MKAASPSSISPPIQRGSSPPVSIDSQGITLTALATARSKRMALGSVGIGRISAATPRTMATLKMFEPTTLPTAMSVAPRRAATVEALNSGVLVPKPTMMAPMTKGETPKRRAMPADERTRTSAPRVKSPRDNRIQKIVAMAGT